MYKIKTYNKIAESGLSRLPSDLYLVSGSESTPDGVLVRSADLIVSGVPESAIAVARAGAGVNNIPVKTCTENGVVVFNTPGANANGVKELTLAAMILSCRRMDKGINWAQGLKGQGDKVPALVEEGKNAFAGIELRGKTIGIIGVGAIGVMLANACVALEMEVLGYDPFISVEAAWGLSRDVRRAKSLDNLVAESDFISIHVPLNDATKGFVNSSLIAKMKAGVRIMNFARGPLVATKDVLEALKSGKVACYATDFPEEALLGAEGVIAIPHLGASTEEAEENCAIMACAQLAAFLETGNITNSVNFPDCFLDYRGGTRITVANKNIPNMIGQITSALASKQINIKDMINKNKGDIAYNIIDIDGDANGDVVEKISSIEGIVRVRILKG